ncbi:MAG: SpoIID/LytB domain-containing protein [Acidimicrobiales bacterium]
MFRSLAALAVAAPAFAGLAPAPAGAESRPVLVVEGRGFGHGVGMAQDGAYAMAAKGSSAAAILSHFYPGTAIARRAATVQVGILDGPGTVVVVLPSGGEVRDAASGPQSPGFPITVSPGGSVSLAVEGGKHKATPLAGAALTRAPAAPAPTAPPATAAPTTVGQTTVTTSLLDPLLQTLVPTTSPTTTVPAVAPSATVPPDQNFAVSARRLWAVPRGEGTVALPGTGRSYRGVIQAAAAGRGLQLINEVDVEQYLRGLGEMPASWPAAALQAQAIAARTFAVRAAAAGKTLCDTQQCQVYIGAGNEHASTSAAAVATRGQVLTHKGALAETVYSASAGGITGTAEEGFGPGGPDLPYLTPVAYAVDDPQVWALSLPLQQAGARLGYRGEVFDARVTRTGPSGRPLEVTFDGANGPMAVDGHRFWAEFALRSTLFTLRTEDAGALPVGEVAARVTDAVPAGAGVPAAAVPGRGVTAATVEPLGRAPWVGLVALLLAAWGAAALRHTRRRPAPGGDETAVTERAG